MTSSAEWPVLVPLPELSSKQQEIMEHLWRWPLSYPPSYDEIGDAVGLASKNSVQHQLGQLADKGWVRRDPKRARALEWRGRDGRAPGIRPKADYVGVTGLALIPAGPLDSPVQIEDFVWELPKDLVGSGELTLWQVRGDSMIDAQIIQGDLLVVREQQHADNGDTVIAMIDGEATVKIWRREADGRALLLPQNPAYDPIPAENAVIRGKLVAMLRRAGR
jgi:repressor LexA